MNIAALLAQVAIFQALPASALNQLALQTEPLTLASGALLYAADDPPDYFYMLINGRLRVSANGLLLGYINRNEPVGEMGVITAEVRSANVHAVRDSLLLKVPAQHLLAFMARYPASLLALTQLVIKRSRQQSSKVKHQGTMAVIPATAGVSAIQLAEALIENLGGWPSARLVTSAHVDALFADSASQTPMDHSSEDIRLRTWLASLEDLHTYIIYAGDDDHGPWSLRCLRQADRVLMLAEAARKPDNIPVLDSLKARGLVAPIELVLLRSEGDPSPYTLLWREQTGARAHYFVQPHFVQPRAHADISALARQISGRGVGLVLGGGGARGFAHIGLIRALEQLQIPIDIVGGTSMGAFVSALLACGFDSVDMARIAYETFVARNYLNDYTLPKVSLIRGQRFHARLQTIFGERRIEELRRSYYCISTNLTTGNSMIHDHGLLATWVGTSMSVPGVTPPIAWQGELLCDGGVVNNLPTDVMQNLERGLIIASNVSMNGDLCAPGAGFLEPDQLALLNWKGALRAPRLSEILMRTATLASDTSIQLSSIERADIYLRMPIDDIGMFAWQRLDELIERGYQRGMETLLPLRSTLPY